MKKINQYKPLWITILVLTILLYTSILPVSAFDFDNVKSDITLTKGQTLTIGDKEIAYNSIWETYKPVEIGVNYNV